MADTECSLAQAQEELQSVRAILDEPELLESHFCGSVGSRALEKDLQQAVVEFMKARLQSRCPDDELRHVLDAFKHFWSIPGSRDSEEHLKRLVSEGHNYYDAQDETIAHFAPPLPVVAGFLYGFLYGLYVCRPYFL